MSFLTTLNSRVAFFRKTSRFKIDIISGPVMIRNYTEKDFEEYYQKYVKRNRRGHPIEDVETFWERKQLEVEDQGRIIFKKRLRKQSGFSQIPS